MTLRVEVAPQAVTQLGDLDAWWREHRPDSLTSVLDEFEHALDALRAQPEIGVPYERGGIRSVRSIRLHGTPYKVYYRHHAGEAVLTVIAVWSSVRGTGPTTAGR